MQTSPRFAYSFPKIGKGTFSPHRSVPRLIFGRAAPTSHQASGLGIAPVQHPNPADLLEIPPTPGLKVCSFCHGERRCEAREKVAVALAFPRLGFAEEVLSALESRRVRPPCSLRSTYCDCVASLG